MRIMNLYICLLAIGSTGIASDAVAQSLPEALRRNVSFSYYEAGHMMYLHKPSLVQLKSDYDRFMGSLMN